ncbi:MAG: hypothetical protein WBA10_08015 [Elainellaceae cyanobacterium]
MVSYRSIPINIKRFGSALAALTAAFSVASIATAPAMAQSEANFGSVTLQNGSAPGPLRGHTQGTTPLSAIARQDANGTHCVGYGETEPDHILVLPQPVSRITVMVNSGGQDTTLLVRAAGNGQVFCADDSDNADARLQGQGWGAGRYQVWVGSFDPGVRYDYQLTVQGNP